MAAPVVVAGSPATGTNAPHSASSTDVHEPELPSVLRKMEKWGSKLAVGEPVWPTRFVPMKTPLSSHLLAAHFAPGECAQPLTLPSALSHCARRGLRVGLVINLAAHHCLYAEEVPRDVPMEHVRMTAKILPPIAAVRQVIRAADAFWEAHPEQYIAIHCDYGSNRTGFVVCCYLVERCGLSPAAALESFAFSRPGGINHAEFREELHARYAAAAAAAPIQRFDAAWHGAFYAAPSAAAALEAVYAAHGAGPLRNGAVPPAPQKTARCQAVALTASHNDLDCIAGPPSEGVPASATDASSAGADDSDQALPDR